MISVRPSINALRKVLHRPLPDIGCRAMERWEISAGETRRVPPAVFLPERLDAIRGAEFGTVAEVVRDFRGGFETHHGCTEGFLFRNVDLVEGVLYANGSLRHLRPRTRRTLVYEVPREVGRGAMYETWVGNRWFGNWLSDDCLAYPLAEQVGSPVTTLLHPRGHVPRYEAALGMTPRRSDHIHFDELILFEDHANNAGRRARANRMRDTLLTVAPSVEHPGVYLLRGETGMRRHLANEREIAERLAAERGFLVLDPSTATVEEIVAACGRARVVAGVEGSHLVHGLMVMPPDATLLVLQPPDRVASVLKIVTDRQGQTFAFTVGTAHGDGFVVEPDDLSRILDMVA